MSNYSDNIMDELIRNNVFFKRPEPERYKLFRDIDPYPEIPAALLNSADIIKYVMTTGMIQDFNIENLSGATYTCEFSGEYICWDGKKIPNKDILTDKNNLIENKRQLVLKPDSITFIAVKQYFRIPSYMVLRFNLRVSHVYKGLLLGTGPIVDPGFEGHIYIPLHNLTSNEYIIKKGARIIDVEFTKMSVNPNWNINDKDKQKHLEIVKELNFNNINYQCPQITANRNIMDYIEKALSKDNLFHKRDRRKIIIYSSLPEKIQEFDEQIKRFDKEIQENNDKIKKDSDRMEKTENYVKSFTFVAFLSVVVACFALAWSVYSYLSNSTITKLNETERKIESQQKTYDDNTRELKKRIDELEQQLKTEKR